MLKDSSFHPFKKHEPGSPAENASSASTKPWADQAVKKMVGMKYTVKGKYEFLKEEEKEDRSEGRKK